MTEHSFESGIKGVEQREETQPPEEAAPLADWIEEELGDEELARFLREHPEGAEFLPSGERLLPRTVFDVVDDLNHIEPMLAQELVHTLDEKAMLPEVSYERAVGSLSSEEMSDVLLRKKYEIAQDRLTLRSGESEKSVYERVFIQEANNALVRLRAKYGLPEFIVPEEAVRFVARVPKGTRDVSPRAHDAFFILTEQSANFSKGRNPIEEFNDLFHELTHFHSYGAVQIDRAEDGNERFGYYRIGLQTRSRQKDGFRISKYLSALNEAVTEETANRLVVEISDDDPVFGEFARNRHVTASCLEANPDFLSKEGLRSHWVTYGISTERGIAWNYSYKEERNVMFAMLKKIYERNPERFEGISPQEAEEELFAMLQKAMFTGNILPFGRLFNETFGRGKFREFGHLQTTEEQQAFIEGL